jgi:hypothetical protein
MGKKYLETKGNSLESSILGLWQEAAKKEEELTPKQKKIDVDGDGEIEASDLAKLRKKGAKKEELGLQEKSADFIRLSFSSPADVKKAKKWMDQNLPGANQGFTGMDASGKDIEFEGVDDAEDLMSKLKKAGFKFKVDFREASKPLDEGQMSQLHQYIKDKKSPEEIAKMMKLDVKTVKALMAGYMSSSYHESYEIGTPEYREHTQEVTPGQEITDFQRFKVESMKEALAKVWGLDESKKEEKSLTKKVKGGKTMTGDNADEIDLKPEIKEK